MVAVVLGTLILVVILVVGIAIDQQDLLDWESKDDDQSHTS
jgi:hypothetical protein